MATKPDPRQPFQVAGDMVTLGLMEHPEAPPQRLIKADPVAKRSAEKTGYACPRCRAWLMLAGTSEQDANWTVWMCRSCRAFWSTADGENWEPGRMERKDEGDDDPAA